MASTETLSRTPPIPPRNPFRRLSTHVKLPPSLPEEPYHIETELIPKPLFSRRTTLPPKTCHVVTVELPSPGLSPIILPSDTSTISSNRSSIVSVISSRPSTASTFVQSEPPSRTASFTSASSAPVWVPPPHVAKPILVRSNTLPNRASRPATSATSSQRPVTSIFSFEPSIKVPALKLPPTRTSCFSPAPVWTPPKRAPDAPPKRPLRRRETPRKETLRSLRAKASVSCFQASPTLVRSQTDTPKKSTPQDSFSMSTIDSALSFDATPDRKILLRSQTDPPKKKTTHQDSFSMSSIDSALSPEATPDRKILVRSKTDTPKKKTTQEPPSRSSIDSGLCIDAFLERQKIVHGKTETPKKPMPPSPLSLSRIDSVDCSEGPLNLPLIRSYTDTPKKTKSKKKTPEKRISLSNMRTYSMDAKGVFILND